MHQRTIAIVVVAGGGLLLGGTAFAATLPAPRSPGDFDSFNVNASCGGQMNLDIGWGWEPAADQPVVVVVTTSEGQVITLVDDDLSDLRGFHPVIPADQLPDTSYSYSVDVTYGEQTWTEVFAGEVRCGSDPIPSGTPTPDPPDRPEPEPITPEVEPTRPDPDIELPEVDPIQPDPDTVTPEVDPTTPTPDPDPDTDTDTDPETGVLSETGEADAATPVESQPSFTG